MRLFLSSKFAREKISYSKNSSVTHYPTKLLFRVTIYQSIWAHVTSATQVGVYKCMKLLRARRASLTHVEFVHSFCTRKLAKLTVSTFLRTATRWFEVPCESTNISWAVDIQYSFTASSRIITLYTAQDRIVIRCLRTRHLLDTNKTHRSKYRQLREDV